MKREVVEVCPHCSEENEMLWDTEKYGYLAYCPRCGNEMMLCDECLNADDNKGKSCDWNEKNGGCRRR